MIKYINDTWAFYVTCIIFLCTVILIVKLIICCFYDDCNIGTTNPYKLLDL